MANANGWQKPDIIIRWIKITPHKLSDQVCPPATGRQWSAIGRKIIFKRVQRDRSIIKM